MATPRCISALSGRCSSNACMVSYQMSNALAWYRGYTSIICVRMAPERGASIILLEALRLDTAQVSSPNTASALHDASWMRRDVLDRSPESTRTSCPTTALSAPRTIHEHNRDSVQHAMAVSSGGV